MNTEPNAVNSTSTPTPSPMSQTGLSTTTSPAPANLPTGIAPSGHGLATLRSLAATKPDAEAVNQQLLQSLRSDLGSQIAVAVRTNSDYEATGYQISLKAPLSESWMRALDFYNHPARTDLVAYEVTRLKSLTPQRTSGEFDIELSISAITEELRDFPEDVVRTVCRKWARGAYRMKKDQPAWFPTLAELMDKCDALMMLRKALLNQAKEQKFIEYKRQDPSYVNPTEAEKARVSEIVKQALKNCGDAA